MTDTTSAPPTDPGPPPTAPPGLPTGTDRFFSWAEGLGIVRADGWLGGVCGGLAARLRIDPIIVRGIFVVVALFGFPALLVYAIAWALLPDTSGRIHLRELFHGRYDAAMTGVFILAVVGFVPVVPWLRNILMWPLWALTGFAPWAWDGSGIWDLGSPFGGIGVILALALIGTAVYFIVRAAQAGPPSRAGAPTASAPPAPVASHSGVDAASPLAADAAGIADPAGRAPAGSATGSETVPAPTPDAADVAAADWRADWRASQEEWRVQNDAWRRSQQDAARAAREQARRERHAHGAAYAAEAEERRRVRRATRPRTSFVFVVTALGAAIVAGALTVLITLGDPELAGFAAAIGILSAAIVVSLAMVVAGIARRRSGFLTAVAIVLVTIGLVTAIASGPRSFVLGNVGLGTSTVPTTIVQPFGSTDITVLPLSEDENVDAGTITIRKSTGVTYITVNPGTAVEIEARLGAGRVEVQRLDPRSNSVEDVPVTLRPGEEGTSEWSWSTRNTAADADPATRQKIVLEQGLGSVFVTVYEPEEER
ncbi:phage shock protein PspC (stress-responsive transcriptional regulator) [Microbacterium trichothecenolyticum]|uniref:PspC domain-containing protein n=1 Tax=Microbacterium trichothecenolyticum TaxID=69370 RepID=UPI00285AA958|nr:PspC domain-containing protein [Microbacterium trichothecenolyticum]MDR7112297.1 phage shock protein PspC (stress-responsive transcriptional regulator) [Microbacterium trichothecenolyticum]